MSSETLFLQPTALNSDPNPTSNFATAEGFGLFSNYSQSTSAILTEAQTQTLLEGGVAIAIAEAEATFLSSDPAFSSLFTSSTGTGLDGSYTGSSNSTTKVVASFAVTANQSFSFDFSTNVALKAKEIESPDNEYNEATSKIGFLLLDTTNPDKPRILDYFGVGGNLISSTQSSNLKYGSSRNATINNYGETSDIDGNNTVDSLTADFIGKYQRTFDSNTNITIVEISISNVVFIGDPLVKNLGQDVIYGTLRNDDIKGTNSADKVYGSLGDDKLNGFKGNDILEGGQGNDWLYGGEGNDTLHGGLGNDILIGGRGNNLLVGGQGYDQFTFNNGDSLLTGERDIIQDFEIGIDKIVFQGWGSINSGTWLNQMFSQGMITNTNDGVLFKFDAGKTQGNLLLSGISSSLISSESITFL